jgi:hypothetical protein
LNRTKNSSIFDNIFCVELIFLVDVSIRLMISSSLSFLSFIIAVSASFFAVSAFAFAVSAFAFAVSAFAFAVSAFAFAVSAFACRLASSHISSAISNKSLPFTLHFISWANLSCQAIISSKTSNIVVTLSFSVGNSSSKYSKFS